SALLDRRLVDAAPGTIGVVVDCSVVSCTDATSTLRTALAARSASGVPNGIVPSATVNSLLTAYPTLTLGEIVAWTKGETSTEIGDLASLAGLTVKELLNALGAPDINDITLGQILNGFVAREDVAWDGLDLSSPALADAQTGGGAVTHSVVVSTTAVGPAPDVLTIELPAGWKLADDGVVDDGGVVAADRLSTSGTTTELQLGTAG